MRIARIRIRNFRSIKDCTFQIGNLCGLIGGNNTGKSNVLTALNFILGDRWPSVRSLDDGDFYGFNQDEDINISIWFDRTRQVRGDVGDPVDYTGILYRVTRYQRRSGRHQRGDLRSEFVCIDEEENPVQILQQPRAVRRSRPYPTTAAVTQDIRNESSGGIYRY